MYLNRFDRFVVAGEEARMNTAICPLLDRNRTLGARLMAAMILGIMAALFTQLESWRPKFTPVNSRLRDEWSQAFASVGGPSPSYFAVGDPKLLRALCCGKHPFGRRHA